MPGRKAGESAGGSPPCVETAFDVRLPFREPEHFLLEVVHAPIRP